MRIGVAEVIRDGRPDRRFDDAGLSGVELEHHVVKIVNHCFVLLAEADVNDDLIRLKSDIRIRRRSLALAEDEPLRGGERRGTV